MTFTLPWCPSVNGYWRSFRGRQILSKRARVYRAEVQLLTNPDWLLKPLFEAAVRLQVEFLVHPPTRRQVDLDNLPKGILDALTHAGVWVDDSQIDDLRIVRGECRGKPGSVLVTVEKL